MLRTLALAVAVLLVWATEGFAAPQAPVYRGEYAISFLGLPVGRVNFESRVDRESYSIEGEALGRLA